MTIFICGEQFLPRYRISLSKSEGKTNKYETEKECSYQELILLSRANPTIHYPKTHVMQQRKP